MLNTEEVKLTSRVIHDLFKNKPNLPPYGV